MALKLPSTMLISELTALVSYWNSRGSTLCRLFVNNANPAYTSVIGDFTEATFTGYSAVSLPAWSVAAFTPPDAVVTEPAAAVFTNGSGASQVVYGYYITDGGGNLLWAERDPAAPVTLQPGQTYSVTLRRAHRNQGD